MKQSEIIVKVGAEGGDVTLYGARTEKGWIFSRDVVDQSLVLLDQPEIRHTSETVDSWPAALKLFDKYPWHKLFPLEVHQEFQQLVFEAVVARYQRGDEQSPRRLPDWKEMCGIVDLAERGLHSIPVFYCDQMVADIASFSPSAAKPREVVKSWGDLGASMTIKAPAPVTLEQYCLSHDRSYVEGVLACRINNGFGNKSQAVADSLPWTSGSLLSAAREAIANGLVAVAPCSGFHHAGYSSGGGFCTFNGLMVTATVLLNEGIAKRVGILDLDMHYGDGSEEIIRKLHLESRVLHYSAGEKWHRPDQAETFLKLLPSIVESFAGCDVLLYQAGADPHIDDPLGGWMTTAQLAERDQIVFSTAQSLGLPVAWNLAGGYQTPLRRVLDIHDATMSSCVKMFVQRVPVAGAARPTKQ